MPIRLRAGAASETGAHRAVNQDAAFTASWGCAVADGVGGGPAGDLASSAFIHRFAAGRNEPLDAEALVVSVRAANWDLRAHVERDPALRGMATTFTGLFLGRSGALLLAHTGDSRAYLLREGEFSQQTRDDSYVQALVDRGLVAPRDAATHPRRNIITASLSGAERDTATVAEYDPIPGDRWLLCSDGLSDYVPHADIEALVAAGLSAAATATALAELALTAGTRDNVTVVVGDVVFEEDTLWADSAAFFGAASTRFNEEFEIA